MRVPVSWLREYVDFHEPVDELARLLTIAGLEVKAVDRAGEDWNNVFVGVVESVDRHPNADRLVLATVDYGSGRITVVTGAPNIAAGQKVALALEGALLVDAHSEEPRKRRLKAGNIRGVRSEGMVCSERELGLSPEHEGILVLDSSAPVGAPLVEALGDHVLDLDLTPNFAYASSVVGLARETAAITGGGIKAPSSPSLPPGEPGTRASVEGRHIGSRYMLQRLDGITIGPSSAHIQQRLQASGLRAINNVVDVTNYVMLECGQPLHPFDREGVQGDVAVRRAFDGEQFETLDHQARTMPPGTVMIADAEKPIGIGGIMGGLHSEVSEGTTSILLESATFEPRQIRRSSRAMGLRTDASGRFEKGLDPELAASALASAVKLLIAEAGAQPVGAPFDWYPDRALPEAVRLEVSEVGRLLGVEVGQAEIARILRSLELQVTEGEGVITAVPPSYRRDLTRPADLVEEVGRIRGYDSVPAVMLEAALPVQRTDAPGLIERKAREWLAAAGLQETINYDLTSPRALSPLSVFGNLGSGPSLWQPADRLLKVINPLSTEREYLRPSLLPGLLQNVRDNLRHHDRVWLYELDRVFAKQGNHLPDEPKRLAIVMTGDRTPASPHRSSAETDLFDLKGIIEGLLQHLNVAEYSMSPVDLGPGAASALGLEIGRECAGYILELNPDVLAMADIDQRVVAAEVRWEPILCLASLTRQFTPYSRYPAVKQDVAVVAPEHTRAEEVHQVIIRNGGGYLRKAALAEVYRGEPLPSGSKSLLYRLTFQAGDRTLTEKDANRVRLGIEQALREQLRVQIRGADQP